MRKIFSRHHEAAISTASTSEAYFPQGLETLYEPAVDPIVDIVFVHGLTGDRIRTWSTSDEKVLWPQAILPTKISNAKILTHGYDAYIARQGFGRASRVTKNRINSHARDLVNALAAKRIQEAAKLSAAERAQDIARPIIFVAHSLGGIICKDALLIAKSDPSPQLKEIFDSTSGIVFMGTPHKGSSLANWAKLPAKALGVFKDSNTNLLSLLKIDSEVLERIHNDFLVMIRDRERRGRPLELVCFYETLSLPLAGIVVKQESAIIQGYNYISMHADHREMTKFATPDDPGFGSLASELKRWCGNIQADTERRIELSDLDQKCLQSLAYSKMESRKYAIDNAAEDTCQWLKESSVYQKWLSHHEDLDRSHGILWIKGKPGSGKSTLMKDAVKKTATGGTRDGPMTIAYFFNARGSALERSAAGMYRSLLHQLLQIYKKSLKELAAIYDRKETTMGKEKWEWHTSELSDFFHSTITRSDTRPLTIFIDALDECGDDEVRKIVSAFEVSASYAVKVDRTLKLCWSSRHYPHISVRHGFELRMEDQNQGDIARYVKQQLAISPSPYIDDEVVDLIIHKSSGVFLWTALVVQRVIRAVDRRRPKHEILDLVQALPPQLDELYQAILDGIDAADRTASLHLFQWVFFARSVLSPKELQLALAFSLDPPPSSVETLNDASTGLAGPEDFRLQVNDLSGGLIEVQQKTSQKVDLSTRRHLESDYRNDNKEGESIVQVIHESVRDFFLLGNGYRIWGHTTPEAWMRQGHEHIAQTCMKYTKFPDQHLARVPVDNFDDGALTIVKQLNTYMKPMPQLLQSDLTAYVIEASWYHFEHAHWKLEENISLYREHLTRCASMGLSSPGITKYHDFEQYHGMPKIMPYVNLIYSRIGCLLDMCLIPDLSDKLGATALVAAAHIDSTSLIETQIERGIDINRSDYQGQTALYEAACQGFLDATRLLLSLGADAEAISQCKNCETGLFAAVRSQQLGIVDLFLEHGASVNAFDADGETPMHHAVLFGNLEIINSLAAAGADIMVKTKNGSLTLLHLACKNGHYEVVKFLLEKGIDVNSRGAYGTTPLMAATFSNDAKLFSLLLAAGADLSIRDEAGMTTLMWAAFHGQDTLLKSLVDAGGGINLYDKNGNTALHHAAERAQPSPVNVLLEIGADPTITNDLAETALKRLLNSGRCPATQFIINQSSLAPMALEWCSSRSFAESEASEETALLLHKASRVLASAAESAETTGLDQKTEWEEPTSIGLYRITEERHALDSYITALDLTPYATKTAEEYSDSEQCSQQAGHLAGLSGLAGVAPTYAVADRDSRANIPDLRQDRLSAPPTLLQPTSWQHVIEIT